MARPCAAARILSDIRGSDKEVVPWGTGRGRRVLWLSADWCVADLVSGWNKLELDRIDRDAVQDRS